MTGATEPSWSLPHTSETAGNQEGLAVYENVTLLKLGPLWGVIEKAEEPT